MPKKSKTAGTNGTGATIDVIRAHEHVLTPGRYVGAQEQEPDGELFEEKMRRLTAILTEQFSDGKKLEKQIAENLHSIGFPLES